MKITRRKFLQKSGHALGAAALLSSLGRFGVAKASAADDYKALVCIFLFGGNDGNKMVIPYDDYASYAAVRGTNATLNISQATLLPITAPSHGDLSFGFHPSLAGLHGLYNGSNLAVICNVGTLVHPITRDEYKNGALRPTSLFSHSDQQAQWQTAIPSSVGQTTPTGWGGRMADDIAPFNGANTFPMIVSVSGQTIFSTGTIARPIVPGAGLAGFNTSTVSKKRYEAMRQLMELDLGLTLINSKSNLTGAAIDNTATLNSALQGITLNTVFPATNLGNQLKKVAQIIAARGTIGLQRQIFFCSLGSFDTHNGQLGTQASLLTQVSQAMTAFFDATVELAVDSNVTTFTMSDFGRTFQPAAGGGTDHAWGNHHFAMGGAVNGGNFYGRFPTLELAGPDDASSEGLDSNHVGRSVRRDFGSVVRSRSARHSFGFSQYR